MDLLRTSSAVFRLLVAGFVAFLILFATASLSQAQPPSTQAVCAEWLMMRQTQALSDLAAKFNDRYEIQVEVDFSHLDGRRRKEVRIKVLSMGGREIAHMDFAFEPNSKSEVKIIYLNVTGTYRGHGLSKILFAEMLRRYPMISIIHTSILGSNLSVYKSMRQLGLSLEDAFFATPAGRTRAAYGFRRLIDYQEESDGYLFTVTRDEQKKASPEGPAFQQQQQ